MEIPSKIYISKRSAERITENSHSFSYVTDKPEGYKYGAIEYTNLSDVWNDIDSSTPITNGEAFEYPIIVYAKLQGVLKVRIVITPEELANIAKLLVTKFDKVLWAYVRDLVPGAKGKGE